MSVQAQLSLSEQQIQEMISQRIRKMDEIRTSVAEIKVKQSGNYRGCWVKPVNPHLFALNQKACSDLFFLTTVALPLGEC